MRLPGDATLIVMANLAERPSVAVAALLEAWRAAGLPVLFVEPATRRPGPGLDVAMAVGPAETRLQAGDGLAARFEASLSARGVTTLVFCGAHADGLGSALVGQAGTLGYRSFVVTDAIDAAPVVMAAADASDPPIAVSRAEALAAAEIAGFNRRRQAERLR